MPPDNTSTEEQSFNANFAAMQNDPNDGDRQYLFLIRHGDRWDYSYPEWKKLPTSRCGDSPLSPLGHEQARQVGIFLKSYLEEHNLPIDNITWMSSPFLRCLQTSDNALNAMEIETKILPEYSIFEWDGHDGEWHQDLPSLEERKHYFPRLDLEYQTLFVPELPEPRSIFFDRCQRAVDAFHQRHPFQSKQIFVMVSHAAGCLALAKTLAKKELQEITPAAPCSIYMFTRTSVRNLDLG
ncbi:histidine phosphatase superfamily protein [Nitzschia inconspicua]|uniref:Histidine phosphatase superfamily protein n=1 Tax=Nitzschia inconspicua TaxID=303405 RepID=A0A9K3PVU6_9STRA|nr:histidine phosphatase superfamily protein [Nitzschia inconspicua]